MNFAQQLLSGFNPFEITWAEREFRRTGMAISKPTLLRHYSIVGGLERLTSRARQAGSESIEALIQEDLEFHLQNPDYYDYVRLPIQTWLRDLLVALGGSLVMGACYAFTKETTGTPFRDPLLYYIVAGAYAIGALLALAGSFLGTKIKKKHAGNIIMCVLGALICGSFFVLTKTRW